MRAITHWATVGVAVAILGPTVGCSTEVIEGASYMADFNTRNNEQIEADRMHLVQRFASCAVVGQVIHTPDVASNAPIADHERKASRQTLSFTIEFKQDQETADLIADNLQNREVILSPLYFIAKPQIITNGQQLTPRPGYSHVTGGDERVIGSPSTDTISRVAATLYPLTSYPEGSAINISVGTQATSINTEKNTETTSKFITECGSLVLNDQKRQTWEPSLFTALEEEKPTSVTYTYR